MPTNVRIDVYFMIQFIMLAYLVIVRPFDNAMDNLVEIVNDAVYVLEVGIVFATNQDYLRSDFVSTTLMIYLIISSGVITFLLIFIQFGTYSGKWIRKWYIRRKSAKVKQEEENKASFMVVIPSKTLYHSDVRDTTDLKISNGDLSSFYREDTSRTFYRSASTLHTLHHNDIMKLPMKGIVPIEEEMKESVGFDLSNSEDL